MATSIGRERAKETVLIKMREERGGEGGVSSFSTIFNLVGAKYIDFFS